LLFSSLFRVLMVVALWAFLEVTKACNMVQPGFLLCFSACQAETALNLDPGFRGELQIYGTKMDFSCLADRNIKKLTRISTTSEVLCRGKSPTGIDIRGVQCDSLSMEFGPLGE
jgi:hypothetical protein